MTRAELEADPLAAQWACLTCFYKFPFGKVRLSGGKGERSPGNDTGLNCPSCRSMRIHPADGKTYEQNHDPR